VSICDYYTTALLKDVTAANEATLLTLVVNTAVIGNYTMPNVGIAVPGILATGQSYNGVPVNLLQYFDGTLADANRGGKKGVCVNFLDGGGAAPLMMNMPADSTTSNQYTLLTHLYSYFGDLLGCSTEGQPGFAPYGGSNSMYQVHKFMDLNAAEVGYFIEQVGLSAASFGVAMSDVQLVGNTLNKAFGYKCAPDMVIIPTQPAALQSICIAEDCPIAEDADCSGYEWPFPPAQCMSSSMMPSSMMSSPTPCPKEKPAPTWTTSMMKPTTSCWKK